MKFYIDKDNHYYWDKIRENKLTAIYSSFSVQFFKNGKFNNIKNADYININNNKIFSLNGKRYGDHNNFTKHSWRKFAKLQAFL
jgi:hypothetical protein